MANLLDRASVVLTPTAYNNGEALCIKPDDASGDFTFSRNSAATRVNAQGLVENVQILSSNLVQNGDFSEQGAEEVSNGSFSQEGAELVTNGDFSNGLTDWTVDDGTSWTNVNNTAFCDGNNGLIKQGFTSVNNKTYKVTFDVVNVGGGELGVRIGSGTYAWNNYPSGSYVKYLVSGSSTSEGVLFYATSGWTGSIDNISVREVGQDWSLGTGWSIGEDKAIANTTGGVLSQSISFVSGKTYKINYEIIVNSGALFTQTNLQSVRTITTSGQYVDYITVTTDNVLRFNGNDGSPFDGSITNVSVKEVAQNWDITGTGWNISDNGLSGLAAEENVTQPISTIVGKKYVIKFTISNWVSGDVYVRPNNSGGTQFYVNGNGTYTEEFTGVSSSLVIRARPSIPFTGTISNISLIEITTDTSLPRINYEGFSYQDALGSEQIVNGDFYTDSDWSMQASWSIANGKASYNGASNGHYIKQNASLIIGKEYIAKFDILDNSGNFRISVDGGTASYNNYTTGNGAYSFTFVASSSEFFIRASMGYSSDTFSIDNVSVKEYLGQEVVPDSGCGSWLWEPQTTQLLPYSEDYSQSSWSKGSDISIESGYLAPDGNNTAYKVTKTGGGAPYLSRNQSLITTTTRSIYARTVSGTGTATLLSHNSNTNNIFTLTEQWQRFELSDTASSSGLTSFYAADFRGSGTLTEYLVWGANATNDQDYATSYIPSNGSQVTRNQDLCTNGGSLASINSTEGVLYAEIAALADDLTFRSITLSDGTFDNRVTIRYRTTSNQISAIVEGNNVVSFNSNFTSSDITILTKIALKYKSGDIALWVNGVEVLTGTSSFTAIGLNNLSFNNGAGGDSFFGKTKALAVWKEALSDAELTSLTTI